MAPLLAFTDCTYREVYFKHFSGIDRAVAPFIVVAENSRYKKSVKSLLPAIHESIPVEPQILCKDSAAFASLASILSDMGFKSVNINMGCPATAVVAKGRGSGFLPYPERIRDFLERSLTGISIPVSVKIRTGLYSHEEIFPIIEVLNEFPLSEVIIHPRLGINKYTGDVNLDVMDEIIPLIKHSVVYNGDISRDSFIGIKDRFPTVSRWMCGRGLLKDPFLPGDIKRYLDDNSYDLINRSSNDTGRMMCIKKFHDDLLAALSQKFSKEEALVGKMKSYWSYMESLFLFFFCNIRNMKKILKLGDYSKEVDKIFRSLS